MRFRQYKRAAYLTLGSVNLRLKGLPNELLMFIIEVSNKANQLTMTLTTEFKTSIAHALCDYDDMSNAFGSGRLQNAVLLKTDYYSLELPWPTTEEVGDNYGQTTKMRFDELILRFSSTLLDYEVEEDDEDEEVAYEQHIEQIMEAIHGWIIDDTGLEKIAIGEHEPAAGYDQIARVNLNETISVSNIRNHVRVIAG